MPDLSIRGVNFSYDGRVQIFRSLAVTLPAGVTLIMGPSGCGKTTLLKILCGIIAVPDVEARLNARHRMLVLQEDALLPWLSGWENLLLFLSPYAVGAAEIRAHRLYELIRDFVHQRAWEMSYGQRRSIELLRVLLARPALLCLDEPLNYMDPDRRRLFAEALRDASAGGAVDHVVIATHEPDDFRPYTTDALRFDGRHPVTDIPRTRL